MTQVDGVGQHDLECIKRLRCLSWQTARIGLFWWNGSIGLRPGGAARERKKEEAAECGRRYGSATTNGLPPTLAFISGTAAAASALLA
jgi:hypothetical protein